MGHFQNRNLKKILPITFFALMFPLLAMAGGGWSGNGGSSSLDQENPWFLGSEPISYCISTDQSSVPTVKAINQLIKINAEKWNQFFSRYGMMDFGNGLRSFPDHIKRKTSTNFVESNDCAPVISNCTSEHFNEEQCEKQLSEKVLFLFGKPNPVVKKYLETHGRSEGVSLRTPYNHKSYRSGGIVWINELNGGGWSSYAHILLHEMGHTLGMVHDSCWVMSTDVAKLLSNWNGLGTKGEVESPNWPYSYKVGDVLLFTDSRVKRDEIAQGFYPNTFLNAELVKQLGFSKEMNFQLRAEITKAFGKFAEMNLIFEEAPSGKKVQWAIKLSSRSAFESTIMTPRLYTGWQYGNSTYVNFGTEYIDNGWVAANLQGTAKWSNISIPVTLVREKGLSLSFFYPASDQWVTFETLQQKTDYFPK